MYQVSADSDNGESDSHNVTQFIELATVNMKSVSRDIPQQAQHENQTDQNVTVDDQDDLSSSDYLKSLLDHAYRAKQCAPSMLQNSKLPEILLETGLNYSFQLHLHDSGHDLEPVTVMVTSPSSSSLNAAWVTPSVRRPQIYITSTGWSDHCQI